jgi:hypothetical protein
MAMVAERVAKAFLCKVRWLIASLLDKQCLLDQSLIINGSQSIQAVREV